MGLFGLIVSYTYRIVLISMINILVTYSKFRAEGFKRKWSHLGLLLFMEIKCTDLPPPLQLSSPLKSFSSFLSNSIFSEKLEESLFMGPDH